MRRIVVRAPGGLDSLVIEEASRPEPGPREIRIKTRCIGLNFADVAIRLGLYDAVNDYPMCPGFEAAGRVEAFGAEVEGFAIGDRVVGALRFGGYAEEVLLDADLAWKIPADFGFAEAVAVPVNLATAQVALVELGRARPGERVLIHSAAGGVGLQAVQLARMLGLESVGTVSRRDKAEVARAMGCGKILVDEDRPLAAAIGDEAPFDLVLDASGGALTRASQARLAPMGRHVLYGFASLFSRGSGRRNWPVLAWRFLRLPRFRSFDLVMKNRSVLGFNLVHLFSQAGLKRDLVLALKTIIARPDYRHPPVTVFAFEAVREAQRLLESGRSTGKIVLSLGGDLSDP